MSTSKGVWSLQQTRDQILANEWVTYDPQFDGGSLWVWGANGGCKFQSSTPTKTCSPIQLPGTQWVVVANGSSISAGGTKSDGTLWSWGTNYPGTNSTISCSSPIQVPGTQWQKTTRIQDAVYAIKYDGTLWAWGTNGVYGQVGDGTRINRSSPVQIPGNQWLDVKGRDPGRHVIAIKTDGTLWGWGRGYYGRLGNGYNNNRSSPTQIPGNQWVTVSVSNYAGVARKSDGTLWSWGIGQNGALGNGSTANSASPVQIPGNQWNAVEMSARSGFATKTDGTLWAWGNNPSRALAVDTGVDICSPMQIPGNQWKTPIEGNGFYANGALKNDNTLWMWGSNLEGNLGDGTFILRSSPTQVPGLWVSASAANLNSTFAKKIP